MIRTYDLQGDAMFTYDAALILNRFQNAAAILRLAERQEEQDQSPEDRARAAQKDKDRQEYVEQGRRRIRDWERRIDGPK